MNKVILRIFTAILALGLLCGAAYADPTATFNANPDSGNAPLTVSFEAQFNNETTHAYWDFGDNGYDDGNTNCNGTHL